MEKLIDISVYPVKNVLDLLLSDKSSDKNIIWATDTYAEFGEEFSDRSQMNKDSLLRQADIIRPRIQKSQEAQNERTRKKGEVFTPSWLCNRMNNYLDEDWFGCKNVFNTENDDSSWTVTEEEIEFQKSENWQQYVDSRRLEITCGEAPYLVSRYDVAAAGNLIVPPKHRIGILDRKLRIVNENATTDDEWLKWVIRAFEASYGYEYQGDNVLIARINLLLTFVDYYEERYSRQPDERLLKQVANIISWNIWQMDGLKDTVPLGKQFEDQFSLDMWDDEEDEAEAVSCKVYNWRSKTILNFMDLKGKRKMGKKLFDYVIGNPPYQETTESDSTRMPPVYHLFMDEAYKLADKVELITPARFLFDAGYTPSEWNRKMLNDNHFKVLNYVQKSDTVFTGTDIKGGVAVSYRDANANFGAIGVFTAFDELNQILSKVKSITEHYLPEIIASPLSYKVSDKMMKDYPDSVGRLRTSAFSKLSEIFYEKRPDDGHEYIGLYGLLGNSRTIRYVRKDYIEDTAGTLGYYKVFVPKANGSGALGEVLSTPVIGQPVIGHTQTFISIGRFKTEEEANNCLKYIKTKFARCMLGILKITQDNPTPKWKYVPLQDFKTNSDIDWSKSIHEIDLQLYRKYGLDEKEIEFIETHVKEMA